MWLTMWLLACGDRPPEVVAVSITPASPTVTDVLTARAATQDHRDDVVTLQWRWFADGAVIEGATSNTLPAGSVGKGVRVVAEATAFDGRIVGDPVSSAPVTTVNTPPTIASAQVLPSPLTAADTPQCVVDGFFDPDGDEQNVRVAWTVDGAPAGDVLTSVTRGQRVSCSATPHDDESDGVPRDSLVSVVANALPVGAQVEVSPLDPILGMHDLWCARTADAVDADGDPVTHRLQWYADGVPWEGETHFDVEDGDTIPAWVTTRARTWTCEAIAADLEAEAPSASVSVSPAVAGTNVLVLLADDMGNDKVGAYGEHPNPPPTPNIDALAAEGVLFRNFYATHGCTSSRASMLTGRHTLRYGLGGIIEPEHDAVALPEEELLIPAMLDHSPLPYATSLTGKWHLSSYLTGSGAEHPGVAGFDWYAGSMENLGQALLMYKPLDYFRWEKIDNGVLMEHTVYATDDTIDDAVDRIALMPEPWMLWVSFNAPHVPLHVPPEPRLTQVVDENSSDLELTNAMIEDLDLAIGDLLSILDPALLDRTTIVFMGDNGTAGHATEPPWNPNQAKSSIYEAGVNVPLIVSGPLVAQPGTASRALVHAVDVYDTVAAIAGVDVVAVDEVEGVQARDGVSFLPYLAAPERATRREVVYTDKHLPIGPPPYDFYRRAVFDGRYKLHHHTTKTDDWLELYDLQGQHIERTNLMENPLDPQAKEAYEALPRTARRPRSRPDLRVLALHAPGSPGRTPCRDPAANPAPASGNAMTFPGLIFASMFSCSSVEVCDNGIDDDADGLVDCDQRSCVHACDADGDGQRTVALGGSDCDDTDPSIFHGAQEVCNGLDDDCDGGIDDADVLGASPLGRATMWLDLDADGFGDPAHPLMRCSTAPFVADVAGDCDDANPRVHPDHPEVCDGLDNPVRRARRHRRSPGHRAHPVPRRRRRRVRHRGRHHRRLPGERLGHRAGGLRRHAGQHLARRPRGVRRPRQRLRRRAPRGRGGR